MAMGECSTYSSLQVDLNVKLLAWPTKWRPPGANRLSLEDPSDLSYMAVCRRWQHCE